MSYPTAARSRRKGGLSGLFVPEGKWSVTIQEVMQQEIDALLGESLIRHPILGFGLLPFAAVTEPNVLVRSPTFLRSLHPVKLENLPGRERSAAFVQVCPSLKYKFLWVHESNECYRDDYKTFLGTFHGVTEELPREIVVDHLYNRDRAETLGTPFIRTVLAHSSINSSQGAGYEKARSRNGLGAFGRDHKMDSVILMKLCGMRSPRKNRPLTAEMQSHIQRVAAIYGLSVKEMEEEIADLMNVAAFTPCT